MAGTDWRLQGEWLKSCSCDYGCPCDFNARPTQGWCAGLLAMHITKGHFGEVRLDGLSFAVTARWPGPLHEGNGTMQPILDARANAAQRDALLQIMSGKHSAEGTLFHIVSIVVSKVLEPIFVPIDVSFDYEKRRARLMAEGAVDLDVEPIKNPVTGAEHRIQVVMPDGFEHRAAEVAHGRLRSRRGVEFDIPKGHCSLAFVEHTPAGVVA